MSVEASKEFSDKKLLDKIRFGVNHEGGSGITFLNKSLQQDGNTIKGHVINFNFSYGATDLDNELKIKFQNGGRRAEDYDCLKPFVKFIEDNSPYIVRNISTNNIKDKDVFELKSKTNQNVWFRLYRLQDNEPVEELPK